MFLYLDCFISAFSILLKKYLLNNEVFLCCYFVCFIDGKNLDFIHAEIYSCLKLVILATTRENFFWMCYCFYVAFVATSWVFLLGVKELVSHWSMTGAWCSWQVVFLLEWGRWSCWISEFGLRTKENLSWPMVNQNHRFVGIFFKHSYFISDYCTS